MADRFLRGKGFSIAAHNYRSKRGEIDLIAEKEGCLVFVEVKKWAGIPLSEAGYSVNAGKKRKIMNAAEKYVSENSKKYSNYQLRFDMVFINDRNGEITHLENVFEGA